MTNLGQRVAVGVVAIPLILLLCMIGGVYFFAFVALASAVALREFYALAEAKGAKPLVVLGIVSGFAVNLTFFLTVSARPPLLVIVLLLTVLLVSLRELFHNDGSSVLNVSTTMFGVLYVSLLLGTLIGIRQLFEPGAHLAQHLAAGQSAGANLHAWGGYTVISVLVVIWICDSAAFHIGSALGKHKLFPRVSPQKSWEGAIAGLVFAVLAALAARQFLLPYLPLAGAIFIGVIVGTIGQLGDLTESLFKRDAGVKDSSTLIPGHGGAFDRFDSVLTVAPCVYLYLEHLSRS